MTIGQFLGIPPRRGRISNQVRAKIRHSHAVLVAAGKPKYLIAKGLSGQWRIGLTSFYKLIFK
jgi:hypothetical protein